MAKFFQPGTAADPIYEVCRKSAWNTERHDQVEAMWAKFEPYCPDPENFLTEVKANFLERSWEMYLACVLLDHGFTLLRPDPHGPDICIVDGERRIWVEATAPGPGTNDDMVPPRSQRGLWKTETGRLVRDVVEEARIAKGLVLI